MEAPHLQPRWGSITDYFRYESDSEHRHEYEDGQIRAMAGGSPEHSLIIANVIGEVRNGLKGKPCRVYDSNLRVRIQRRAIYTYPDATIICGAVQFDPDDPRQQTALNPRVIIEVLSPNTEAYDRGRKFERYREIAGFEEYVLVSQVDPRIETFRRQGDGRWLFQSFAGLDAAAEIGAVQLRLPLAEVYAGVTFPPPGDDASPEPARPDQSNDRI